MSFSYKQPKRLLAHLKVNSFAGKWAAILQYHTSLLYFILSCFLFSCEQTENKLHGNACDAHVHRHLLQPAASEILLVVYQDVSSVFWLSNFFGSLFGTIGSMSPEVRIISNINPCDFGTAQSRSETSVRVNASSVNVV